MAHKAQFMVNFPPAKTILFHCATRDNIVCVVIRPPIPWLNLQHVGCVTLHLIDICLVALGGVGLDGIITFFVIAHEAAFAVVVLSHLAGESPNI